MKLLELIIGAVIAWVVPKILDSLLERTKRDGEVEKLSEPAFPWLTWCVALALGGAAGGFLSGTLGVLKLQTPGAVANWTVFGLAIGVSQWIVLRKYLGVGPFWAVASVLGWSTCSFFEAAKSPPPVGWAAASLMVGVLQSLMLVRIRHHALWWVPANIAAWLIAAAVALTMAGSLGTSPAAWVLLWTCVGLRRCNRLGVLAITNAC